MLSSKMHEAFTLIEFIFVIVIIAILAAIAIPKLAAVRMDAIVSAKAQNIMISANEIASYATSQGRVTSPLSEMSNSLQEMINRGEANDNGEYQTDIKLENVEDCIIIKVDDPNENTNILLIEYGETSNPDCDQLRSLIDKDAFPMPLRGSMVSY